MVHIFLREKSNASRLCSRPTDFAGQRGRRGLYCGYLFILSFQQKKLQTKPCPIRYLHTVLYYGHTFDVCLWKRRYVRPLQQLYLRRRRAVYRDKSRTSKSHIYGAANIHAGKANFYAANVRAAGLSPADVQIARKTDPADSAHADQPDDELSIPI